MALWGILNRTDSLIDLLVLYAITTGAYVLPALCMITLITAM